jgi:O-antigen ligase
VFSKISARWYSVGAAICVLLLIMLGILYLWFYKGGRSGMIYEASELLHGRWKNDFGSSRIYIWRNVLNNVKKNLLFGTGPDTLGYWGIEPFTKFDASSGVSYIANFDSAHNEFMQILACSGIISLICYIGAIAVSIVKWLRTPDNTISAVAGAGMVFYCIHAFFSITMFITTSFFWVTFGVLIYAQYAQKNAVQSNTDSSSKILKQSGKIERRYR